MKEYIERMMSERDELCGRVKRLEKFLVVKRDLGAKRTELMEYQLQSMKDYLYYLEERLHYELTLENLGGEAWDKA